VSPQSTAVRVLAIALCAALAGIVALVAGILSSATGASLAAATLTAGGAFGGAMFLGLAVVAAL
jgi:hypothetical protein